MRDDTLHFATVTALRGERQCAVCAAEGAHCGNPAYPVPTPCPERAVPVSAGGRPRGDRFTPAPWYYSEGCDGREAYPRSVCLRSDDGGCHYYDEDSGHTSDAHERLSVDDEGVLWYDGLRFVSAY